MLSEWEIRQLVEIERELSSDRAVIHGFRKLSAQRNGLPGLVRRFYPAGYLLSAVTYMLMSMAGSAARAWEG